MTAHICGIIFSPHSPISSLKLYCFCNTFKISCPSPWRHLWNIPYQHSIFSYSIISCHLNKREHRTDLLFKTNCHFQSYPSKFISHTVSVTDLDQWIEVIIFESILTTFQLSIIFRGSWGISVYRLEPKIETPEVNLACPKPWNTL